MRMQVSSLRGDMTALRDLCNTRSSARDEHRRMSTTKCSRDDETTLTREQIEFFSTTYLGREDELARTHCALFAPAEDQSAGGGGTQTIGVPLAARRWLDIARAG